MGSLIDQTNTCWNTWANPHICANFALRRFLEDTFVLWGFSWLCCTCTCVHNQIYHRLQPHVTLTLPETAVPVNPNVLTVICNVLALQHFEPTYRSVHVLMPLAHRRLCLCNLDFAWLYNWAPLQNILMLLPPGRNGLFDARFVVLHSQAPLRWWFTSVVPIAPFCRHLNPWRCICKDTWLKLCTAGVILGQAKLRHSTCAFQSDRLLCKSWGCPLTLGPHCWLHGPWTATRCNPLCTLAWLLNSWNVLTPTCRSEIFLLRYMTLCFDKHCSQNVSCVARILLNPH